MIRTSAYLSALAAMLLCGCFSGAVGPSPIDDGAQPEGIVATAREVDRRVHAEIFREAALKCRAGAFAGDREFGEWIKTQTAAARKAAYKPLDELAHERLGDGKWTAAAAEQYCGEVAAGFEGAR